MKNLSNTLRSILVSSLLTACAVTQVPTTVKAASQTPDKTTAKANQAPDKKTTAKVKARTNKSKVSPHARPAIAASTVNQFNRLLKPPSKRHLPPAEDGIHDPADPAIDTLQSPRQAFRGLPPDNAGNQVDWVKALNEGKIKPRWDLNNPKARPMVMDLNIVLEVKGSMPNVVYPHKPHTQWLDCSNCHPAIFIPKKGANQISMAAILLGKKCGVCHGTVAFPVSECRRCHSQNKKIKAAEKSNVK